MSSWRASNLHKVATGIEVSPWAGLLAEEKYRVEGSARLQAGIAAPGDAGSQGPAALLVPSHQDTKRVHRIRAAQSEERWRLQQRPQNPTKTGLLGARLPCLCVRWNHTREGTPGGSCPSSCVRMYHVCPFLYASPIAPPLSRSPPPPSLTLVRSFIDEREEGGFGCFPFLAKLEGRPGRIPGWRCPQGGNL